MEKALIEIGRKKLNWDDDIDHIPLGDSRDRLDVVYPDGDTSVMISRKVVKKISHTLPSGTNRCIGKCQDVENNAIIYFIANSNNYDCIIKKYSDDTFQNISYAKNWGFSSSHWITSAFIIGTGDNALLCFNDNYNEVFCVNIANLIASNYPSLKYNEIHLYKPAPLYKPEITIGSDTSYDANNIRGKLFQFAYSYIYDTKMESCISPWSEMNYDMRDSFDDGIFDTDITVGNKFDIDLKVGLSHHSGDVNDTFENVEKIALYFKICDIGVGQTGAWKLYDIVDLTDSEYHDNIYHYTFYNDKIPLGTNADFYFLQEEIPLNAGAMELINGERIALGELNRKYSDIDLDVTLSSVNGVTLDFLNYNTYLRTVQDSSGTTGVIDIDLKTPINLGNILWEVFIQKIDTTDNSIEGDEKYFYEYYTSSTSSGYMANTDPVSVLVDQINNLSNFAITASSVTGGHPKKLRISINPVSSNTDKLYYICFVPKIITPIVPSMRENNKINLGIKYFDKYGRGSNVLIKNIGIKTPYTTSSATIGHYIQFEINHEPPSWAVSWQLLISDTGYPLMYVLPCILNISNTQGAVSDLEETGSITKLNISQALARCQVLNEKFNFNYFDPQAGDRIRILGHPYKLGSESPASTPNPSYFGLSEIIDIEILDVDDDGKLIIPSLKSFSEYDNFQYRNVYYIKIYRNLLDIDAENQVYKEVGQINSIVNSFHTVNSVTFATNGTTPQDQTAYDGTGPAIGTIDYGAIYLRPVHFFNITVYDNVNRTLGDKYGLIPIFCYVPCMNTSFIYDSLARSTGRSDYYKDNYINETEHAIVRSGLLKETGLNYNQINKFNTDLYYMDNKHGAITYLLQIGYNLFVFQQKKITPVLINRVQTSLADGSTQMVYSDAVLGDKNPFPQEVGCSHPGSIVRHINDTIFFDYMTAAWYMLTNNGPLNITEAPKDNPDLFKMKAYGIYLSKLVAAAIQAGGSPIITAGYDPVKNMYMFYYGTTIADQVMLGFHIPTMSWLSFYSVWHEGFMGFNENKFYSFLGGEIYEHHVSTQSKVTTGYIQIHFNKFPNDRKLFRMIEENCEEVWEPSTAGDITVDENAVAYQNPDSKEWQYAKMSSLLKSSHFIDYEGAKRAIFKRNMLNKKGVLNGNISLLQGELLRGKTVSLKLRDKSPTDNTLRSVIIGFEKSL